MNTIDYNEQARPLTEMDERIERFLRGQMSQDEADAFRAEMKSNVTLHDRAVLQARLIKQMREVGAENQQRIADAMQAVDEETIRQIAAGKGAKLIAPHKPMFRRLIPWIAAAAVFCLVVLVGKFNTSPKEQIASVPVKEVTKTVTKTRHDKLEELALLRGKIEMGVDVKQSTKQLQAIYDKAKKKKDSVYAPYINDIALALAEGYSKTGKKDKEKAVLDDMLNIQDGTEVANK